MYETARIEVTFKPRTSWWLMLQICVTNLNKS